MSHPALVRLVPVSVAGAVRPVNRVCALCGAPTAGALCSRCVRLPGGGR